MSDKIIDTIAEVVYGSVLDESDRANARRILAALKAQRIAVIELPEQTAGNSWRVPQLDPLYIADVQTLQGGVCLSVDDDLSINEAREVAAALLAAADKADAAAEAMEQ